MTGVTVYGTKFALRVEAPYRLDFGNHIWTTDILDYLSVVSKAEDRKNGWLESRQVSHVLTYPVAKMTTSAAISESSEKRSPVRVKDAIDPPLLSLILPSAMSRDAPVSGRAYEVADPCYGGFGKPI